MAQTADTQCASNVPSSQVCGYANAGSVAISSESGADSNQTDWVHAWMRKVDQARASQPHFVSPSVTTHGLVLGGFPLAERLHLSVGAGVQIAVTQFHQYNHRWIVLVRFPL
jgi:hypothetical protein